jgi:drug/metabolite transporter (DMT)-like permease
MRTKLVSQPPDDVSRNAAALLSDEAERAAKPPLRFAQALLSGYLLAAVYAAATYAPGRGVPAALAARGVAVAVLAALLLRRRPRTWAQLAATLPALGLAVGVVVGAWPLARAGAEALAASWGLARAETWATMAATAGAVMMARRRG